MDWCGFAALIYLYGRRLRVHATQEILAGVGVAVAVALVFRLASPTTASQAPRAVSSMP